MQAVEFVMEQHDDELWEELIRLCLQKPEMDISVIVLYCRCCHSYHLSCLEGRLDLMKLNSSSQDCDEGSEDADGTPSGESQMSCVLCTTATA
ncbi:hypothetical protein GUJ93_ZPchr0458g22705 [Zizania palustris]|uniref:Uncharacterized protein n=1 Tax=Zizania palustris TaxID=103762 RepID=A0A8J5VFB1_ZIZPA|nr:hypothetical protein GUJ93_ZPchr0458g22705 [Zizania palustris]